MNKIAFLVLFFLFMIPVVGGAGEKAFNDELNAKVTQLTVLLSDSYAEEYLPARGVKMLRKGIGNTTVAVVVFSLVGFGKGNNGFQYLAVFNGSEEKTEDDTSGISLLDYMMVGGIGIRSIEFDQIKINKIENGILITIPAKEYGTNDASCCPSIKTIAQFKLKTTPLLGSHRLEEIKKQVKKLNIK